MTRLIWEEEYKNYCIQAYQYFPSGIIEVSVFDYNAETVEDVYTHKFMDYTKNEIISIVKQELKEAFKYD
jgi:hypothetical protein|tara:strand:- start:193 stop:402 length:210 start_codon:yes stop_codon:yes gene_type:complete